MNAISSVPAVFRFEWSRSITVPRIVWWLVLALFPALLLGLIRLNAGPPPSGDTAPIAAVVYVLVPCVVCVMGVLLWATPAIAGELESRSWVYLSVRPHGATAVLFGKYLVAVAWTIPAGLVASTLGLIVMFPNDLFHLMWVQWALVIGSCCSYAAVFTLIGVIWPKRAMVFGVFYAIVVEALLSMIPAVVNLLTVQYRLRCLFVRWMDFHESKVGNSPVFRAYFGEDSAAWHCLMLFAMTGLMLAAAALVLRIREFTASAETDV